MSDETPKVLGTTRTVAEIEAELAAARQRVEDERRRHAEETRKQALAAQYTKLRTIWKALETAIVRAAPEGQQFTLVEGTTPSGEVVFNTKLNGKSVYAWTLDVTRDRTSYNTAVRGFNTYADKGTYSISVGGCDRVKRPKKRFPEKKDGSHSYTAAAAYFWESIRVASAVETARQTSQARYVDNTALLAQVPDALKWGAHNLDINPSTQTDGCLTVKVRTQYELTPQQVVRLAELLEALGKELAQST